MARELGELLASVVDRSLSAIDAARLGPGQTVREIQGWLNTCDSCEIPVIGPRSLLVIDRSVSNGTVGVIPAIDSADRLPDAQRIRGISLPDDLENLRNRETIRYLDASLVVVV